MGVQTEDGDEIIEAVPCCRCHQEGIMQFRIARMREDQEPGKRDCAICRNVFWLGEATAWGDHRR